jgi:hypothetical protein
VGLLPLLRSRSRSTFLLTGDLDGDLEPDLEPDLDLERDLERELLWYGSGEAERDLDRDLQSSIRSHGLGILKSFTLKWKRNAVSDHDFTLI